MQMDDSATRKRKAAAAAPSPMFVLDERAFAPVSHKRDRECAFAVSRSVFAMCAEARRNPYQVDVREDARDVQISVTFWWAVESAPDLVMMCKRVQGRAEAAVDAAFSSSSRNGITNDAWARFIGCRVVDDESDDGGARRHHHHRRSGLTLRMVLAGDSTRRVVHSVVRGLRSMATASQRSDDLPPPRKKARFG
jgi:hypothetical protein